ncbi:MAG: Rne/Rng family ribonuclease [Spartobacteria bacterium]|nr:Rne/Rng family ribonuclease [Spartobacteria bacterium]
MFMLRNKIKKEIIINVESLQTRAATLEEGKFESFFIERNSEERLVGSIFKGKIQNLEDGLQAAFVDIGMKKNAFIHYWDMIPEDAARLEAEEGIKAKRPRKKRFPPGEMQKLYPIGSKIVIQITKDAIGTKGPRATANVSIPGRYLVMMPGSKLKGVSRKIDDSKERQRLKKILSRLPIPESCGLIVRTAGSGARKLSFARDARGLIENWRMIEEGIRETPAPCRLYQELDLVERVVRDSLTEEIDRIVVDDRVVYERLKTLISRISRRSKGKLKLYDGDIPVFEHFGVEKQLATAFKRKVWLESGGYLIFDETEALVAIDVNTGRHKGGDTQEEVILQVNLEAADEVSRQLRLRNVGGLVVIDFIDMRSRRHQAQVYRKLKDSLKRDRARTNVYPISPLGLIEMTRQRVEESIYATKYENCPYCRGRGKVLSPLSMSVEIQRHIQEVLKKQHRQPSPDLRVTINPHVLDRLRSEDEAVLVDIEKRYATHLTFASDNTMHVEEFIIANAKTSRVLFTNVEQIYHQQKGNEG